MFLTAQRVVALSSRNEGINAFYHVHGKSWADLDSDPETVTCKLVKAIRTVPAGVNRVRSYLDLVAPDMTSPGALISDFQAFILGDGPERFPCEFRGSGIRIRMGVERSLAASWRAEAQRLFYECLHVWMGNGVAKAGEADGPPV